MIFLIAIIAAVLVLGGVPGGYFYRSHRIQMNTYGYKAALTRTLSWPACQILENYARIPASNRPDGDIYRVVSALDKKYGGKDAVDEHYRKYDRWSYDYEPDWNDHDQKGGCTLKSKKHDVRNCSMPEYKDIKYNLQQVEKALGEQEYALEMAGISSDVELATSMIDQLKAERETIQYVTKGLTAKEIE